jgi:hypothetical protein
MNAEDQEAMRALDVRLGRMHRDLDTRPGFEDRLAARIAEMERVHAAAPGSAALARLESLHQRERHAADRQARLESVVVAVVGLGTGLAVWRFAPLVARLGERYAETAEASPVWFAAAAVLAVGAALWAALRRMGLDPGLPLGT